MSHGFPLTLLRVGVEIRAALAVMGVVNESGNNQSMSSSKWLPYVVMACWYTGKYLGGTWPNRKSVCKVIDNIN
jgi:hypothetical protein